VRPARSCSAAGTACTGCGWPACWVSAGRSGCWPRWVSRTSRPRSPWLSPPGAKPAARAVRAGFLATFGSLYLTWNAGTLAGALGAGKLGSPGTFGLDVVGPAAFLALLWPRLRDGRTERTVALAGALIALAATPFCPPGLPIVLAAAAALGAALLPSAGTLPPAAQAALSLPLARPPRAAGLIRPGPPERLATGRAGERDLDRGAGHRGVLLRTEAGGPDRAAALAGSSPGAAVRCPGARCPAGRPDRRAGRGRGESLAADPARLAGLGAAAAALLLRAPFLVVILAAAGTAAALRALGVA